MYSVTTNTHTQRPQTFTKHTPPIRHILKPTIHQQTHPLSKNLNTSIQQKNKLLAYNTQPSTSNSFYNPHKHTHLISHGDFDAGEEGGVTTGNGLLLLRAVGAGTDLCVRDVGHPAPGPVDVKRCSSCEYENTLQQLLKLSKLMK